MVETVMEFLKQYLSPQLVVFIISMLPILELRGGLIASKLLGVPWLQGYVLSIVGNMLPVPFIIFFIERILTFLQKKGPLKKLATSFEEKGRSKGQELAEKYPTQLYLGLFLFVAIPLPGTGAWTGSLIAALMGLPPKKAAPTIAAGVIGASIIMSILTYAIPGMFGF